MASGEDPNAWLGLLKWSLSHQDGTAPSEARPMGDEVRVLLNKLWLLTFRVLNNHQAATTDHSSQQLAVSEEDQGRSRRSQVALSIPKGCFTQSYQLLAPWQHLVVVAIVVRHRYQETKRKSYIVSMPSCVLFEILKNSLRTELLE